MIRVILEVAAKRSFASALDWPGWSRGGKTPEAAIDALLASAQRYARVASRAGLELTLPAGGTPDVVERLEGGSGTEFGVPGAEATAEAAPVSTAELQRLSALLRAAWEAFDDAAAAAVGVTLTVGPRGGGRSLEKILGHVRDAESAYVGQLGSRPPRADGADVHEHLAQLREAFLATLVARVRDEPLPDPRNTRRPWSPRYAVRRSAWHSLDHAWELEDRSAE